MRHNITKKVISAMLSGVLMLSLAGCGKVAKLPETVVNTSLVVEKDGKVESYLVNTFDKDFYSLDGLTQMVQEEAEEFNAAHGDAAEPPMAVKAVQMLGDGATVQVVQEFTDTESYADYNEQELFYGTRVEALAEGISVDLGLVSAADGTPAEEQKLNKALDKNHMPHLKPCVSVLLIRILSYSRILILLKQERRLLIHVSSAHVIPKRVFQDMIKQPEQ